jgi:hypothetical protein
MPFLGRTCIMHPDAYSLIDKSRNSADGGFVETTTGLRVQQSIVSLWLFPLPCSSDSKSTVLTFVSGTDHYQRFTYTRFYDGSTRSIDTF